MYWPLGVASLHALPPGDAAAEPIIALGSSASGGLLATATASEMFIWQTQPMAIVALLQRSPDSIDHYGRNVSINLHGVEGQSMEAILSTEHDFLIIYAVTLTSHPPEARYKLDTSRSLTSHRRRSFAGAFESELIMPYSLKQKRIIKVDSRLSCYLTLDDQLVIATERPPAIQYVMWQDPSNQSHTELLAKMDWINCNGPVVHMVYDKRTNLLAWVTKDGSAYSVRKPESGQLNKGHKIWKGWKFHDGAQNFALQASINARFSLVAVACKGGIVYVYIVKDYCGNVGFSHRINLPHQTRELPLATHEITRLAFSHDGYALLVVSRSHWYLWSVYGHFLASGSVEDTDAVPNGASAESTEALIVDCCWGWSGLNLIIAERNSRSLQSINLARNVVTQCYNTDTIAQPILQLEEQLLLYKGTTQKVFDIINPEASNFSRIALPSDFFRENSVVKFVSVSADVRYVSLAGSSGFAHVSTATGRWRLLETLDESSDLSGVADEVPHVRGGMCWYGNILLIAGDFGDNHEVRLYHRNASSMNLHSWLHKESFPAPILLMSLIADSLLVYCQDNTLYHFLVVPYIESGGYYAPPRLVQFGQINFKGIIHSPNRVRAISWIQPEDHIRLGDPSEDASVATVVFVLDGKLVMLRPAPRSEVPGTDLKYDMRVLADKVEFFMLLPNRGEESPIPTLNGSVWAWDGKAVKIWISPLNRDILRDVPISINLDFYPLTIIPAYGIIVGVESVKGSHRASGFSSYRLKTSTQPFIHRILQRLLELRRGAEALCFASEFSDLYFFPHILELLLHDTLEREADSRPSAEEALLPRVIELLRNFPKDMLDVVVGCTRKTEIRLWRYLFQFAGRPKDLFEQCMERGMLKSAGGYLLVLHTLEHLKDSSQDTVRLLTKAINAGDWDLCKELARFLTSFDNTGNTLRKALTHVGLPDRSPSLVDSYRRLSGFMLVTE